MFEQLTKRAERPALADGEAERLRHDHIAPQPWPGRTVAKEDSRAAAILRADGLGPGAIRVQLDRLVASGILPSPWLGHAGLLRSLGIDLAARRPWRTRPAPPG